MKEIKKLIFLLMAMGAFALPALAQKGDDKKPPPKERPPVVVVPPKGDREKPREQPRDNPKKPD